MSSLMKRRHIRALVIAFVALLCIWPCSTLADSGLTVAPAELKLTIDENTGGTAYVYITSGFSGELVVGTEDIPFQVGPELVSVSDTYVNKKVALTFHNDPDLEDGEYAGKLTFLARTGTNVAYGIKINININWSGEDKEDKAFSDYIADKYMIIIIVIAVLAALSVGMVIGRKMSTRKNKTESITGHESSEDEI